MNTDPYTVLYGLYITFIDMISFTPRLSWDSNCYYFFFISLPKLILNLSRMKMVKDERICFFL